MNWEAVGAIGSAVGAAAVVITLVYLAVQIRENSRQLRLTSTMALNSLVNQGFDPIYNNSETIHIWTTGLSSPESLTEAELETFFLFMARLFNPFETAVTHDSLGALDADTLTRYVAFWKNIIQTPGGKAWLDAEHMVLTDRAKRLLEVDLLTSG